METLSPSLSNELENLFGDLFNIAEWYDDRYVGDYAIRACRTADGRPGATVIFVPEAGIPKETAFDLLDRIKARTEKVAQDQSELASGSGAESFTYIDYGNWNLLATGDMVTTLMIQFSYVTQPFDYTEE